MSAFAGDKHAYIYVFFYDGRYNCIFGCAETNFVKEFPTLLCAESPDATKKRTTPFAPRNLALR